MKNAKYYYDLLKEKRYQEVEQLLYDDENCHVDFFAVEKKDNDNEMELKSTIEIKNDKNHCIFYTRIYKTEGERKIIKEKIAEYWILIEYEEVDYKIIEKSKNLLEN